MKTAAMFLSIVLILVAAAAVGGNAEAASDATIVFYVA